MKKLLLLLPFVTFCFQVSATQFYWVGASGANWSVATNWKMGGFTGSVATTHPRTSSDSAYMGNGSTNATITLDSSFSIRALFFLGSGQIFINGAGKRLTVSGDFNTSANIGTTGGGSSTIRMAGGTITGNATSEDVGKLPNLLLTGSCSLNGLITMGGSTTLFDSSATISAGTSTVVFYYNDSIKGNPNFNNAEFQGNAGTHTVKDSTTVADSLKISGSGACTINTGTVKVQGDINIGNTSNGGAGGAGTATIKLNGSGSQTITSTNGTTGLGLLPIVNIAKTGGTLNLSGVISVAGSWLNNYNGTVNAGTSEVYLKANSGNTLNIGGTYPTAFYQLMLDSHGGTYNFAIDSAAIITNELLMVGSGNIVCNNHSLVIKGDVSITNTGGGIGNSAFIFNGNNSQTITSTGSGDNGFLTNVIINKDGGTLSLSGIISIDGGFTNNYGGTINAGTSTVLFRAGSGITFGIAGSYSTTFYNLDLESEGGVFSFDRDSAAIVTGKLLLIGGSQLTCNNHSLSIKGNMQMTNSNAAVNGNTVFTVCGTGAQGFSGSVVVLNNVVINKPAGAFTLSQYLDINTNLTLTKANIVSSSASLLYFKNGATVTGASDSSFVSGPVAKAGNQAFRFPVGDPSAAHYKPISISAPGTTSDVFTAQYYNSGIADGHDGVLTYVDPCEYWNIGHTTGSSAVHDTLFWNNPCFHIASLSYFKIGYVSGSTWTSVGTCSVTSGSTPTLGSIASTFVAGNVTLAKTNPLVYAYAGNDTAICNGLSATLHGTVTGGTSPFTYSWSPATGLSNTTAASPTATLTVTATYVLTVTDNLTEVGMDTMVLTISKPVAYAGRDTAICFGLNTLVGKSTGASGGISPYTYVWLPASGLSSSTIALPTASPTTTTTYALTVTDNIGCTATNSVLVKVNSNPVAHSGSNITIWAGANAEIGVNPAATGGTSPYTYLWNPSTGLNSSTISQPIANPTITTSYTLTVTDSNACIGKDTTILTIIPLPALGMDNGFILLAGANIKSTDSIRIFGKVGADSIISGNIISLDSILPNGIGSVPTALAAAGSVMTCIHGLVATTTPNNLSGQMLSSGVYRIMGKALLTDSLTLIGDSSSIFIIDIDSSFAVKRNGAIKLDGVNAAKVFFNIRDSLILEDSVSINGNFFVQGNIIGGYAYGRYKSLVSLENINLNGVRSENENAEAADSIKEKSLVYSRCGLNFKIGSVSVNRRTQRSPSDTLDPLVPETKGQYQPATITISGVPLNSKIIAVIAYTSCVGTNINELDNEAYGLSINQVELSQSFTLQDQSGGHLQTFTANYLVYDDYTTVGATCWDGIHCTGFVNPASFNGVTRDFRAQIPASYLNSIGQQSNGDYILKVNDLPTLASTYNNVSIAKHSMVSPDTTTVNVDFNGMSIIVVYESCADEGKEGYLRIDDGLYVNAYDHDFTMYDLSAPNGTSGIPGDIVSDSGLGFILIGDIEQGSNQTVTTNVDSDRYDIDGSKYEFFLNGLWNCSTGNINFTPGETQVEFGIQAPTECYSFVAEGIYYQENSSACAVTPLRANVQPLYLVCSSSSPLSIGGSPTASGGTSPYTYSWSPATGLSSSTVSNPTVSTSTTGITTYAVTITDAIGCTSSATTVANVVTCCTGPNNFIGVSSSVFLSVMGSKGYDVVGTTLSDCTDDISISTLFILNGDIHFKNCPNIEFSPQTQLIVPSGYTLEIDNSHLYPCNNMWQGIHVTGTGKVIVHNNSIIEGAITGILSDNGGVVQVYDNTTYGSSTDGTFKDNYEDIVINNDLASTSPSYIYGSSFISTRSNLLAPYSTANRTHIAIDLNNVKNITIGIPPTGSSAGNLFDNFDYGIYATSSSLSRLAVYNNTFQCTLNPLGYIGNLTAIADHPAFYEAALTVGSATLPNSFHDCLIGIQCSPPPKNTNLILFNAKISSNTFISDHGKTLSEAVGISGFHYNHYYTNSFYFSLNYNQVDDYYTNGFTLSDNFSNDSIMYNSFLDCQSAISITNKTLVSNVNKVYFNGINDIRPPEYLVGTETIGISLSNQANTNSAIPNVACNTVTMADPGSPIVHLGENTNYGILLQNCENNEVTGNDVTTLDLSSPYYYLRTSGISLTMCPTTRIYDNSIEGFNYDLECNGPMQPTTIANNSFTYGHYGFVLGADLGNVGPQGTLTFFRVLENNNRWTGFDNTNFDGGAGEAHTFNNGAQKPTTSTFITDYNYYTYCPGPLEPQPKSAIAQFGITFYNPTAMSFSKRMDVGLYCGPPTIITPTDSMYTADVPPVTFTTMDTDWVLRAITDTTVYDLDTSGTISDYERDFSVRKHFFEKQQLYSIAKYDSGFTYTDSALLSNFMDTTAVYNDIGKIDNAENLLMQYLMDTIPEDRVTDSTDAAFAIYSIRGAITAALNSKTYLTIYSSVIADDSTPTIDSAGHATLVDIATQCPWVGGRAVFEARALLKQFDTLNYISECETPDTTGMRMEQPVSKKTEPQSALAIYPNPASNVINISYTNASDNTWFVLYDILGKEVGSIQLNKGNGKIPFNTININDGLYFWKVTGLNAGGDREGKIVVTKP